MDTLQASSIATGENRKFRMPRCKELSILGTRGIPAAHGGFETFAERLALYMTEQGSQVTVYCQGDGDSEPGERVWRGVRLVNVPVARDDAVGTIIFDWRSTRLAARERGTLLTLGYNTGLFAALPRMRNVVNLINMDGLEWKRQKWRLPEKAWLYLNERFASWWATHLVADHPEIKNHLLTRAPFEKITVIPYGADRVTEADPKHLNQLGLEPNSYAAVIARAEPENSLLEIVEAFSSRTRGIRLVVLGTLRPQQCDYHRRVMEAASEEVLFPGAIYDREVIDALRLHCRLFIHGHTVGGTNPTLVEALGAGSPVLAHDNKFNRWVAGEAARYFSDTRQCTTHLDRLLNDEAQLDRLRAAARARHAEQFTWERILQEYDALLGMWSHPENQFPAEHSLELSESSDLVSTAT